jgi:hypothetical protein
MEASLEEIKEKILAADPGDVPHLQGKAKMLRQMQRETTPTAD